MRLTITTLFVLIISFNFLICIVSADWAYMFVVNERQIFVISEEHLDLEQIGLKIGEVTKFSDMEGTYSGNFSNRYPEGTEYYEITGVAINQAIAIKDDHGVYIKATFGGKYVGNRYEGRDYLPYVFGVIIVLITGYLIKKKISRN